MVLLALRKILCGNIVKCETVCPALSHILINTYCNNSQLFVDGQCILSKEGTTQGDPLAMAMYTIGTQPLIRTLDGIAKQRYWDSYLNRGRVLPGGAVGTSSFIRQYV